MCSIFGIFGIEHSDDSLRQTALKQSRLMLHRGPDWEGTYQNEHAVIVHERLKTVLSLCTTKTKLTYWPSTAKSTIIKN